MALCSQAWLCALRADDASKAATNGVAKPIEIVGVHNAFRVSEKIYSGSQPESDAAFAALKNLGVKTIVSVDGGKPEVSLEIGDAT